MSDSLIPSFLVSDVSKSLRSLTKNERCERIAQVTHQNWATMSELLRLLRGNERSRANRLGCSQKTSNSLGKPMSEFPVLEKKLKLSVARIPNFVQTSGFFNAIESNLSIFLCIVIQKQKIIHSKSKYKCHQIAVLFMWINSISSVLLIYQEKNLACFFKSAKIVAILSDSALTVNVLSLSLI